MANMAAGGEWAARMAKRKDFDMMFVRRASETESQSISESTHSNTTSNTNATSTSPASPESAHSTKTTHSHHSFDQVHALQLQLQRNAAQIEANEARMQELQARDARMGKSIQQGLSTVSAVNEQLSSLREMLARAERVSRGEFGIGVDS